MPASDADITIIYRGKFAGAADRVEMRRALMQAFRDKRISIDRLITNVLQVTNGDWEVIGASDDELA